MKNCIQIFVFVTFFLINCNYAFSQKVSDSDLIPSEKNPATAFACSLIIPGLGQMYNEDIALGFAFFGGSLIGSGTYLLSKKKDETLETAGIAVALACYLISLIEAPISALSITKESRYKRALKDKRITDTNIPTSKDYSINILPYFNQYSYGIQLKLDF